MTTGITTAGKYQLFKNGWTTKINRVKLYTDTDVLVDTQNVTFSFSTDKIVPTATIEFDVDAGTLDVSYVSLIYFDGSNEHVLFNKSFSVLYDFPTQGYLRITAWNITVNAANSITWDREYLFTQGWESWLDWVGAYIGQSDTLVGNGFVGGVTANASTGELNCDNVIINIPASTNGINTLRFAYLGSLNDPVTFYRLELGTSYNFTNDGKLIISNLKFTL